MQKRNNRPFPARALLQLRRSSPFCVAALALASPTRAEAVPAAAAPVAAGPGAAAQLLAARPLAEAPRAKATASLAKQSAGPSGAAEPTPAASPSVDKPRTGFRAQLGQEQEGEAGERDLRNLPGQQALIGGLSLSVGAGVVAGQSTFQVAPGYADNAFVAWSSSFGAAYQFSDLTRLRVGTSVNQELTVPNGQDERYALILGDTSVGLSRPLHRFRFGTLLLGSVGVRLPTSEASRVQTLQAAATVSARAIQPLGKVLVIVGSSFGKNFHKYTNPVIDPQGQGTLVTRDRLVSAPNLVAVGRAGGNESISPSEQALGGVNNRSFSVRNSISANYSLTSHVGLSLSYSLGHSWSYESFDLDENAGVGARAGRGRTDFHSGGVFAGYILSPNVSMSAGMSTGGSPRTADDRRLRFPFFTFGNQGVENNLTTFSLGISFTERVRL